MKFRATKIQEIFQRDLFEMLRAKSFHWDWPGDGSNQCLLNCIVDPPRSQRFKLADRVGLVWRWVVMDTCPSKPGLKFGSWRRSFLRNKTWAVKRLTRP